MRSRMTAIQLVSSIPGAPSQFSNSASHETEGLKARQRECQLGSFPDSPGLPSFLPEPFCAALSLDLASHSAQLSRVAKLTARFNPPTLTNRRVLDEVPSRVPLKPEVASQQNGCRTRQAVRANSMIPAVPALELIAGSIARPGQVAKCSELLASAASGADHSYREYLWLVFGSLRSPELTTTTPIQPRAARFTSRLSTIERPLIMIIHHDTGHLGPNHGQRLAVSSRFSRTACAQCVEPTPHREGTAEYGQKAANEPIGHDVPLVKDGTKASKETKGLDGPRFPASHGSPAPLGLALGDSTGVSPALTSEALQPGYAGLAAGERRPAQQATHRVSAPGALEIR